ncbi:MAG TPA: DUF885 family protein [Burkholderiaceae bacterium]|jgi:uncharacterized protein (DUF885 family)|nr:DUF885 family protein [Burkholderiaceae bacterium]
MRRRNLRDLVFALMAFPLAPSWAAETVHDRLTALAQEFVDTRARLHPMLATELGIPGHDGELEMPTEASRAAEVGRLQQWRERLEQIARSPGSSRVDADDARLLRAQMDRALNQLQVYQVDRKSYGGAAVNLVQAIYTQLHELPVAGRDGATVERVGAAWNDIIERLNRTPAFVAAAQRLVTRPGHRYGIVDSQQLAGAPDLFNGPLTDAAKGRFGEDSEGLRRFAKARDAALAALSQTRAFIDAHVAAWPENFAIGRKAYDRMLREEKLLPFGADDLIRMGHMELEHGWAEEAWLRSLSRHDQVPFGPPSGGGLAPGGADLIAYYRDRIAELRRFVADRQLVTVPDWLGDLKIEQTPEFMRPVSPGAAMNPPRLFSASTTGYYYITPPDSLQEAAARLDMNEDFDRDRILSTAAHEAMPGHFMQWSIAKRHSNFIRKIQDSGEFSEGWAFYGEEMFVRLGLYGQDLDARLFTARWERVRGARAIVDPMLATGQWSFDQAVRFYAEQTEFTPQAAEAAVSGIALGPGYVIAYTAGRAQLEDLLGQYLRKAGERASLRDFHDRLLSYGTTPFAIVAPELIADLDKSSDEVRAAANY